MITKIAIKGFKALKNATIEFYTNKNIANKNKEVTKKHKLLNNNFVYTFNLAGIIGANATGKSSFLDAIYIYKQLITNKFELNIHNFEKICGLEKVPKEFIFEYLINGEILKHVLKLTEKFELRSEELLVLSSDSKIKKWISIFLNDGDDSLLWRISKISKYEKHENFNLTSHHINLINQIFDLINKITPFDNNFGIVEHKYFLSHLLEDFKPKKNEEDDQEKQLRNKNLLLLKSIISAVDPSIIDLKYDYLKEEFIVVTKDNNQIVEVPFENISDGTKRFIYIMRQIILENKKNKLYIIDEIENSFHPKIVDTILRLFYFNQHNIANAQLIFTTHNPYIFDAINIHNSCINVSLYNSNQRFEKLSNFSDYNIKRNDKLFSKNYMLEIINSHPDSNNIDEIYNSFINNGTESV